MLPKSLTSSTLNRDRALRFVLELADVNMHHEGDRWRSAGSTIIMWLFDLILDSSDSSSENRMILQSFLPTQLSAMSDCFSAHLAGASDDQRMSVIERLVEIHLALPAWPILPWTVIEDLLSETMANTHHASRNDVSAADGRS